MVAISLGWNCHSAAQGVNLGLRALKANGYKTCPFDESLTNYPGIVKCIRDDFKDFCSPESLCIKLNDRSKKYCVDDILLHNTAYKFVFNHESPGHADLWQLQSWSGGINHYIDNNYKKFIERYSARVDNFRTYLTSGEPITFLITHPPSDFKELREALSERYPNLQYSIERFDLQYGEEHYTEHLKIMEAAHL